MFDASPTPWPASALKRGDVIYTLANLDAVMRCLGPAVKRSHGEWQIGDVIARILSGDWHLWTSERDGVIEACAVTQFQVWPKLRVLRLIFVGGEHSAHWVHFEDEIAAWAKAQGCTRFRGVIERKGMLRLAQSRGWRELYVEVEKLL